VTPSNGLTDTYFILILLSPFADMNLYFDSSKTFL